MLPLTHAAKNPIYPILYIENHLGVEPLLENLTYCVRSCIDELHVVLAMM